MATRSKGRSASAAAATRQRQRRIGPYRLVRCLGSGAFAKVYAAVRHGDDAWVAVKVIPAEADCSDSARQRLLIEGHLMVGIDHPNLVRYLDVGEENGDVYVVQELLNDGDAASLVATHHGMVPPMLIAAIGRDAARGLHILHQCGLLHRDIKPANLLLTSNGGCKIGDLGLVRPLREKGNLTAIGLVVGTPSFIAPEQIRNEGRLDGRADIYGLAASLYWLATGETPHQAPNLWTMLQQSVSEPFPDPRKSRPDLSAELGAVIRTAGDKDAANRHPTASALANDFDDILASRAPRLAGLSVELRPETPPILRSAAPTVLLVGNDPLLLRLYAGRLVVDGWKVKVNSNREEAEASLRRKITDLVVLDLPVLAEDGEEFLRTLRCLPGMAGVPLVALVDTASNGSATGRSLVLTRIVNKQTTSPRELSLLLRRLLLQPTQQHDHDSDSALPIAGLAHAELDQLRPLLADLRGSGHSKVLESLAHSARSLSCLAATVGLSGAAAIADAVELLARHLHRDGSATPEAQATLQRAVDALIAVITTSHPGHVWPPQEILILEGDPLARRLAQLALARAGLTASCIQTQQAALAAVKNNAAALLLVDVQLLDHPDTFLADVRSRSSLPVVLAAPPEVLRTLPGQPNVDQISKPYSAAELVARIVTLLVLPPG